jgi:molybdenum cofactor cytidylyltransferase
MIIGILLAAGISSRFGSNKLLHPIGDGTLMAVAAARNLMNALTNSIAVIKPDDSQLEALLTSEGMDVVYCDFSLRGMGASLSCGIQAATNAKGWVIALADMPFIQPATITCVADAIKKGAELAAPHYKGRRGHPIGFSQVFGRDLSRLDGDKGGRELLQDNKHLLHCLDVDDPGVLIDIDTCTDRNLPQDEKF